MHKHKTLFFFACGHSAPVRPEREGRAAAWLAGTLAALSVQGHKLSPMAGVMAIRVFFWSLL